MRPIRFVWPLVRIHVDIDTVLVETPHGTVLGLLVEVTDSTSKWCAEPGLLRLLELQFEF